MKLKMVFVLALIWIAQSSFGQVSEVNDTTVAANSFTSDGIDYKKTTVTETSSKQEMLDNNNALFYTNKEWRKIKRQIKKNKKRITNSKEGIHTSKVVDTIYLHIKTNSQLTNW